MGIGPSDGLGGLTRETRKRRGASNKRYFFGVRKKDLYSVRRVLGSYRRVKGFSFLVIGMSLDVPGSVRPGVMERLEGSDRERVRRRR